MYSPKEVQKATNAIISALEKRQLKEHSIHQYAQHYQELNTYIENNGVISVDEVTFRDFLVYQYGVHILSLHARGFDGIAGGHIRPLAILNWYLVTGEVDSRARVRTPPFICPEGFCDSYDAFMNYLGLTEKRAQVSEIQKSAKASAPADGRRSWL